jgi:hypothetical protein
VAPLNPQPRWPEGYITVLRACRLYGLQSRDRCHASHVLTPLPGTRLFDRFQREDRLLYTNFPQDWEHYDMTEVIHRPGCMEPHQLDHTMEKINRQIYARPALLRKALLTLWQTRNMTATMFAWNSNINYRNVNKSVSR